ncbi:hypothetical protein NX82_00045, partial [Proteus mirabilis]
LLSFFDWLKVFKCVVYYLHMISVVMNCNTLIKSKYYFNKIKKGAHDIIFFHILLMMARTIIN